MTNTPDTLREIDLVRASHVTKQSSDVADGAETECSRRWFWVNARTMRHLHCERIGNFAGVSMPVRGNEPETSKLYDGVAAMIAAAPDLVRALEQMIEVYWGTGDGELPEPQCIQDARSALLLARGDAA